MINYKKGIYWHDWASDPEADMRWQVLRPLDAGGIEFERMEETDRFDLFNPSSHFDVLFFDYGGVGLGNSLLYDNLKYIIEHANDHPSRYYVMVSEMTTEAIKEIKEELGDNKPCNIFDCIDDFIKYSIEVK